MQLEIFLGLRFSPFTFILPLTLVCKEHLGEWRHSDQEVQHCAAVGVVRAIVVRLDRRHGVILTNAFLVFLLQVLHNTHTHTMCFLKHLNI